MSEYEIMEEGQEIAEDTTLYSIDLTSYEEQQRSFVIFSSTRLCSLSHDKKGLKSDSAILNTFKQCCSKQAEFWPSSSPLRELIFRIFLGNGNQPLTLQQVNDKLQQQLINSEDPRSISIEKLQRIVKNDLYYRFTALPQSDVE